MVWLSISSVLKWGLKTRHLRYSWPIRDQTVRDANCGFDDESVGGGDDDDGDGDGPHADDACAAVGDGVDDHPRHRSCFDVGATTTPTIIKTG